MSYTGAGRKIASQSQSGGWYEYSYDSRGLLSAQAETGKESIRTDYYPDGSIKKETDRYGISTLYNYDKGGLVSSIQTGNKITLYEYDSFERLIDIKIVDSRNRTEPLYCERYEYFPNGRGMTVIKGEKNGGIALLENILTGINPPEYSGFIELFGEKLKKITPALLRKNGAGIVSSKKYLVSSNPNLTVKELLMPFLAGNGFSHCKKDAEAVQSMIEAEKIDISADEPVSNLSGGMLQRLILARELAAEPKLLILADPLYGLDYKTVRYLEDRLTAAASAGTAVVVLMADADDGFSKWNCLYEIKEGQIHKGNDL